MARYLLLFLALVSSSVMIAQASLSGKVLDDKGEAVILANVVLYQNGNLKQGVESDYDGNYSFSSVDPGKYDLEVSSVGANTNKITGIVINAGKAVKVDVKMTTGVTLEDIIVVGYKVPLVEKDNTTQGQTITSEQIRNLPTRNINALAATTAGLGASDEGNTPSVRGSRNNATFYYVDGIRVSGSLIPESEIEQLQVVTGGVEAQYGDVTGGVISLTTKGPSSKFSGGFEAETSEYLDAFGNSLIGGNLSGPIWRKNGKSVLGFRVAGRYTYQREDNPPAIPVYRAKSEVLDLLEANPVSPIGAGYVPTAQSLGYESVNALDARPNEEFKRLDLTAKIDAQLSKNIDVALTGAFNDRSNRYTPGASSAGSQGWRWGVYNYRNNPTDYDTEYRVNFRFRHRIGGSGLNQETQKNSFIQNASYTLQFGYEKNQSSVSDATHGDNLFAYGHVGQFNYDWRPVIGASTSGGAVPLEHVGYFQNFTGYTAGTSNPILANYNNASSESASFNALATNGFVSNLYRGIWDFHSNVGTVLDLNRRRDLDLYTFQATSSFDLVPSGDADKGRHSIQFGILYEQRTSRGYDINPRRLWQVMRQQANSHIIGIDTTKYLRDSIIGPFTIPIYGNLIAENQDLLFYKSLRNITGQAIDEFANPDALNPDQFSLDMFSARELNDQDLLTYWGYDYLGNKTDVAYNDFFTVTDADGRRTFPVAAVQPIYSAAYIQDKFQYRDIIFRLGVRVDRFDANTRTLKDPYALYDIQTANDFHAAAGTSRPGTIGENYKVYVDSDGGDNIQAYRNGDTWYRANGTQVNDGVEIFGGSPVFPKYTVDKPSIKSQNFDPNISFNDYEPQINWMPRLAFSFPINDDANFFAHYDVLAQRPPSNTLATPLDYFYFEERTGIRNNPALRPERTVDYEVGFQQKLTNSTAIKLSAYYKELRDMIQLRNFLYIPSPITRYQTFDNIDFGTVKGFSVSYDMRRTKNLQLAVNYTLQFADGTGSDPESSRGLNNRGLQRILFPLSFDERHRVNLVLDYRYGSGNTYNGPRIGGVDIFANTGINIQSVAVSGRPYTAKNTSEILSASGTVGSINGSRLPWNYVVNMRIDKQFKLTGASAKHPLNMNVYMRISNLLDRRNITGVYGATGSPTDDGYLRSARGLNAIDGIITDGRDIDSYVASYQWAMLNPSNFTLPRRIFVGAIFDF